MRPKLKRTSIAKKLAAFLAVMLTLQCVFFTVFLLFGGTLEYLDHTSLDILNQQVSVRRNYLQNEMVQRWSNLDRTQELVGAKISTFLADNALTPQSLTPDNPHTAELFGVLTDTLITLLRTNSVTGVFLVLQGGQPTTRPTSGITYAQSGLSFQDMDPSSNPADNSDITVERGSSALFHTWDLAMDVNWKPIFQVSENYDFYFEPLQAANANAGATPRTFGYWSAEYSLTDHDVSSISYSQPLFDKLGHPYGVLGVEISTDYLYRLLPPAELASESGAYLLATLEEEGTYRSAVSNGATAKRVLDTDLHCHFLPESVYNHVYRVDPDHSRVSQPVYAGVQPLSLYNAASPFTGQTWVLIGLTEASSLFSLSASIARGILIITLVTTIFGILLAFSAGNLFTQPFRALAQAVRHLDPYQPAVLPSVYVQEIDDLADAITRLGQDVSAASSRMTRVIELSHIPLATFELDHKSGKPHYTKNFFSLLGLPEPPIPPTLEAFQEILTGLDPYREPSDDANTLLRIPTQEGYLWIRLQVVDQDGNMLGVLTDVTPEIVEKRRLEYERDYDLLTNLLNRRAFRDRLSKIERRPETLKTAAMLMFDLDNLKYLNDTYGHDCGDEYIRCAADVLRGFTVLGGLAARVSGDEFYLFLSGYGDRAALQLVIRRLQENISAASILLPNGQRHRLRASLGVAWYPDDSRSLNELVRYADFAMYMAKKEDKGGSRDFNLSIYHRDAFLLYSQEELNRILEEQAVDYAFQPIVSCADGSILGYEALMRPRSKALSSPQDLLRVARAHSKLPHVERLTWFRALEIFTALDQIADDCLLFVNSMSSQALSPEDLSKFISTYRPHLSRLVIEMSESDELDASATEVKQSVCRQNGMRMALDDYGSGYSNDSVLLSLHPEFIKVDISIIHGIDQDQSRQTMLRNVVSLCRDLHIQVIAEGVETSGELQAVIALGADYIQGYYTGRPALTPAPMAPSVRNEILATQVAAAF